MQVRFKEDRKKLNTRASDGIDEIFDEGLNDSEGEQCNEGIDEGLNDSISPSAFTLFGAEKIIPPFLFRVF